MPPKSMNESKPNDKTDRQPADSVSGENDRISFDGSEGEDGYLSQMFASKFEHRGRTFTCNEQYVQAAKADLFKDEATFGKILETADPKEQKALGKQVTPWDEELWHSKCYRLVLSVNYLKFTKSEHADEIRAKLLATGNKELCEASPRGLKWGIGMSKETAPGHKGAWPGQNWLGKALMRIRDDLRKEAGQADKNDEQRRGMQGVKGMEDSDEEREPSLVN